MLFRSIVLSAMLVGALSGSLVTAVQVWQVNPIILSAERFESAPAAAPASASALAQDQAGDKRSADAWGPSEGVERTGYTLVTNVLTAVGLALVILVAMMASLRTKSATKLDWRHGLLWGAAGYAVFFLAPALGLPPEIPGAIAAPLKDRQLWWLFTVVFTAAGLAGAIFGKHPWRWAALGLLVVPFLVGAPHTSTAMFANQPPAAAAELAELERQFIAATAIAAAVLWLALGLSSAWTVRRFVSPRIDPLEE